MQRIPIALSALLLTISVFAGEAAAQEPAPATTPASSSPFPGTEAEAGTTVAPVAATPPAVVTVNKRFVHAAQELRGARSIIRVGGDLQAGPHMQALMQGGTSALGDDIKAASKKTK